MNAQPDRSIPHLLSDAFAQLATLLSNEITLAKAEISDNVSKLVRSLALVASGAVLVIPAIVVLLFSAAAALRHTGLSDAEAYLVSGGVAVILSGVLIVVGLNRFKASTLAPEMTLRQLKKDKGAAEEMVR